MKISHILKAPRRTRRAAHILRTFAAQGLGELVVRLGIQKYLPPAARMRLPMAELPNPPELPARLAKALEELGPTFVKFGQMLSSRPDLLPPDYIEELQRICHHVAPFSGDLAREIIAKELDCPLTEVFSEFDAVPVASGSIAQVHAAKLLDGTDVVVKVRRPNIEGTIEDDLAIMAVLAEMAQKAEEFRALRLPMLVEEFAQGLRQELNLLTEAAQTHKFYEAFKEEPNVRAPRVFWDLTTPSVLTLERLMGAHLSEFNARPEMDAMKPVVARLLVNCFLKQFFEMGTFHADPHVGNILVRDDGTVALVDFGLVGRLNDTLRGQFSAFLIAVANRQMELAAEVLSDVGSVPFDDRADDFRNDVARMLELVYSIPVERINLQRAFLEIMYLVRKYNVVMPRDFVMLGKAMVTVGGIAMAMDPRLNIGEVSAPYARRLARGKITLENVKRTLAANAYQFSTLIRSAPRDIKQFLARLRRGAFDLTVKHEGLEPYLNHLERTGNRLALSIMLAAILISSTHILVNGVGPKVSLGSWNASVIGLIGYFFGFILGAWLVIGIFRSGRV